MAELAEALALQGRPVTPKASTAVKDFIKISEGKKREKVAKEKAQEKKDKEIEDLVYNSVDVDFNKIHPFNKQNAVNLSSDFTKKATRSQQSPNSRSVINNLGNELKANLSELNNASKNIYSFEKYFQSGGYLNDEDLKVFKYIETGNPLYIKNYDLKKSAAIKAFDPETGNIIFDEFKKMNLAAYATKKYFAPKERVMGKEGRFDIIGDEYDKEEIRDVAEQDLIADKGGNLWKNAELMFREEVLSELEKEINPITGEKIYDEIDANTLKDPTFIEDYEEALIEKYGNYASGLDKKSKQDLRARPRARVSKKSTKYASTLEGFGWENKSDGYYNGGSGEDIKYTAEWRGSTQPVSLNLSGSSRLFNATNGDFEPNSATSKYQTAEIEIAPIYTSGNNKGKPVPDSRLEEDKNLYEYESIINLRKTYKDEDKQTIEEKYIVPLPKARTAYYLGLSQSEKKAASAQFKVMGEEVDRLNKDLKESLNKGREKVEEKTSETTTMRDKYRRK